MNCLECRYYDAPAQTCKRYPAYTFRSPADWCGEHAVEKPPEPEKPPAQETPVIRQCRKVRFNGVRCTDPALVGYDYCAAHLKRK